MLEHGFHGCEEKLQTLVGDLACCMALYDLALFGAASAEVVLARSELRAGGVCDLQREGGRKKRDEERERERGGEREGRK
jgi:hypothetical protein